LHVALLLFTLAGWVTVLARRESERSAPIRQGAGSDVIR
jgi:hypothetical protein